MTATIPVSFVAIILVLFAVAAFRVWWVVYNSPERVGARGERRVAETLLARLPQGYYVINNIYLPLPDGTTTQIDHVVVSRYGIFVIETKTYSGWIFGDERSPQWMQTIYRKRSRFQNPIQQNYRHVCALADCLDVPKDIVKDLVVFNGECKFKTEMPLKVVWRRNAAEYILSHSEILLKDKEVSDVVAAISEWSDSIDADRRKAHVSNLCKRHSPVSINAPPPPPPPQKKKKNAHIAGSKWCCGQIAGPEKSFMDVQHILSAGA